MLVAAGQIWLVKLPSMLFTFRRVRLFVATAIHPLAASSIDLCSLFSVGRVCFFFVELRKMQGTFLQLSGITL